MRSLLPPTVLVLGLVVSGAAPADERSFDDPMFQRCINWMLDGERGSMIDNVCLEEYEIPPPSLFMCARKVQSGFASATDREACALIFEEQARKVRAGFIK